MPKIQVTPELIKATIAMEAGWKPIKLIEVKYEPSSKKDSMNYEFVFEVTNTEEDKRPISLYVNDKNKVMLVRGLIQIYEGLFDVVVTEDQTIDMEPEKWVGLSCWGDIAKEMYQNRPTNKLVGFSSKVPF